VVAEDADACYTGTPQEILSEWHAAALACSPGGSVLRLERLYLLRWMSQQSALPGSVWDRRRLPVM